MPAAITPLRMFSTAPRYSVIRSLVISAFASMLPTRSFTASICNSRFDFPSTSMRWTPRPVRRWYARGLLASTICHAAQTKKTTESKSAISINACQPSGELLCVNPSATAAPANVTIKPSAFWAALSFASAVLRRSSSSRSIAVSCSSDSASASSDASGPIPRPATSMPVPAGMPSPVSSCGPGSTYGKRLGKFARDVCARALLDPRPLPVRVNLKKGVTTCVLNKIDRAEAQTKLPYDADT
jgi:hypothetical protein